MERRLFNRGRGLHYSNAFLESKMFDDLNIEIFATDISHRVLHSARRGAYQKHAFRATDSEMIKNILLRKRIAIRFLIR